MNQHVQLPAHVQTIKNRQNDWRETNTCAFVSRWYGFNELAPVDLCGASICSQTQPESFSRFQFSSFLRCGVGRCSWRPCVCVESTGVQQRTHMYSAVRARFGERIHLFCNQSTAQTFKQRCCSSVIVAASVEALLPPVDQYVPTRPALIDQWSAYIVHTGALSAPSEMAHTHTR